MVGTGRITRAGFEPQRPYNRFLYYLSTGRGHARDAQISVMVEIHLLVELIVRC